MMRNVASPAGASLMHSIECTRAKVGPTRHQSINESTATSSPSATTSTDPSARLRTEPAMPRRSASRAHDARKPTPWTLPLTMMRVRVVTPADRSPENYVLNNERSNPATGAIRDRVGRSSCGRQLMMSAVRIARALVTIPPTTALLVWCRSRVSWPWSPRSAGSWMSRVVRCLV